MKGPAENIAGLAGRLSAIIAAAAAETGEPGLGGFVQGLESLSRRPRARLAESSSTTLPVCRHFGDTLAAASGEAAALAGFLRALQPYLSWTQNPNYRRAPPAPGFLENYGYAVIAGPDGGAPALVRDPHLAFGVLLLGPRTEYPAHHHPAAELYVPLGRADWAKGGANEGGAEWMSRPPGSVIHHPPNVVHATKTHDIPLAALYLWAGDLATHARLAD
jgi:Dimethlysulfonioproprionate lyase